MAKIIAITLTLAVRGSDLKLEMLEAVDTIATDVLPMGRLCCRHGQNHLQKMPRDGRYDQVPLSHSLDFHVPYLSKRQSSIPGADQVQDEPI